MEKLNNKTVLLISTLLLLLLFFGNMLLKSLRNSDDIMDYKAVNIDELKSKSKIISDRKTYYTLEGIVNKYIMSYIPSSDQEQLNETPEHTYEEYYDALTEGYESYLKKDDYLTLAKTFLNKFYVISEGEMEGITYMDTDNVLKEIYEVDTDSYLCHLSCTKNNKDAYIGLKLETSKKQFSIFYLE